MPFVRIERAPAIDRGTYETVIAKIDLAHNHPLGLFLHTAGEVDGSWQVVNVWESKVYADEFDRSTLLPALREVTGQENWEREVTGYEVASLITP